jgi:hypothetical protein
MLLSRYFLPILKETPKEAEIVSHRLMLRAGMLRQQAAGNIPGCRSAPAPKADRSGSCARNRTGRARWKC